jgi:hypothetical protein
MIWVDAITRLKSRPENVGMWKFYSMIFISMAMALNLLVIVTIIEKHILKYSFYQLNIDVFPGSKIDSFINFFLLFLALPLSINYLLIFRNNRYEKLIEIYKAHNGKLCVSYLILSYFLPLILLFFLYIIGVN